MVGIRKDNNVSDSFNEKDIYITQKRIRNLKRIRATDLPMLTNDVLGTDIHGVDNYMLQFDRIIHYPVDIKVCFVNTYLLERDLSSE